MAFRRACANIAGRFSAPALANNHASGAFLGDSRSPFGKTAISQDTARTILAAFVAAALAGGTAMAVPGGIMVRYLAGLPPA
ncbi:hypothetical protein DPQ22_04155 [Candidatus Tokpelaia sp.]|nr:hypothetical protein DPQ22_04155 [Candidatus Tokpelaia sp.]